jgi:hypothetical protein
MLTRLAGAANRHLAVEAAPLPETPTLAALATVEPDSDDADGINWTRVRALVDWVRSHADAAQSAIADPPARTGDERLDNLLAAIAEKLADDHCIARPSWVRSVAPGVPVTPPHADDASVRLPQRHRSSSTAHHGCQQRLARCPRAVMPSPVFDPMNCRRPARCGSSKLGTHIPPRRSSS